MLDKYTYLLYIDFMLAKYCSDIDNFLKNYNEGIHQYKNLSFKKAIICFKAALNISQDDHPCLLYIERCEDYLKEPPPENWDKVFILKSK